MNGLITPLLCATSAAFVDPGDIGEQLNNNSGLLAALIALSIVLLFSTYKKKNDEAKAAKAKEAEQAPEEPTEDPAAEEALPEGPAAEEAPPETIGHEASNEESEGEQGSEEAEQHKGRPQ